MVKNLPANAGDAGSIPGSASSPGGRHGNPLQYSCLENHMDRGAGQATVHGVTKSHTTEHPHALRQCALQGRYDRHLSLYRLISCPFLTKPSSFWLIAVFPKFLPLTGSSNMLFPLPSTFFFKKNIYLFGCTRS